ncbi:NPC intracellular cholesterol transporter 1 [Camellia lanceoleosa]|uniref:NPC intracellular cholesterol transporter 1 n=1 Tax=Camellia lanceoleosa TaxID=1840588 RepID=A0ACC0IL27_9ERIC|nr:NPC intracellular cholesterol transporter 1 [Camellia lanceoleosa]
MIRVKLIFQSIQTNHYKTLSASLSRLPLPLLLLTAPIASRPLTKYMEVDPRDHHNKEEKIASISPWKPKRPETRGPYKITMHSFWEKFDDYTYANMDLDIDTKKTVLKASPSVVSVVSLTGGNALFMGSGTIIDCENVNGTYCSTILTSASLLRSSAELEAVPEDIKIDAYISDGKLFDGRVFAYDFHSNIAFIKIESNATLPTASLRLLEDSISIDPNDIPGRPHSNVSKLCPGDIVVAVGRFFDAPYNLMAARGQFSLDCCKFDCKELFRANCKILKGGHGAYTSSVDLNGYESGVIRASEFRTYHTPLRKQDDFVNSMRAAREFSSRVSDSLKIEIFPYSVFYIFFEQYLDIWETAVINIAIALGAVFLVCLVITNSLWEVQTITFTMVSEVFSRVGSSLSVDMWQSTIQGLKNVMDVLASKTLLVEDNVMAKFYTSLLHCLHLVLIDPKGPLSDHVAGFVAALRMNFCRPWLGMEMTNLYVASVDKLERIIQKFPNIVKGVLVEKVRNGRKTYRSEFQLGNREKAKANRSKRAR